MRIQDKNPDHRRDFLFGYSDLPALMLRND
jgi:hypothetical protein